MAYIPLTPLVQQFFDNLGDPLVGGTLNAYVAGTSTPTNFYSDNTGTVAGSSITLDSRGEPTTVKLLWVDSTVTYKFILKDSTGITVWTEDNITVTEITNGSITESKIANSAITTAKIANSAITTAKIADNSITFAKFQNSGNELGFRNLLHNGGFQIQQRTTFSTYGMTSVFGPDRWTSNVNTGSFSGGQFRRNAVNWTTTGYAGLVSFTTVSNLALQFNYRMESIESSVLNGKTVTLSGKFYHNGTSSININVQFYKPRGVDNYSTGEDLLYTSSDISIASGVATPFSVTYTFGASDVTNGLDIIISNSTATKFTGSTTPLIGLGDMQLEIGANATAYQIRPIGYELMLCQRYFETGQVSAYSYASAASQNTASTIFFKATKRATPIIAQTNVAVTNVSTTTAQSNISTDSFLSSRLSSAAGATYYNETWTASAEL